MAHRLWGLTEIVGTIAANLVDDKAVESAVALASCSKFLEEPALEEVWRSLSRLSPLITSFPPEVWEIKEKLLCFKRVPLRAEWTRFQQRYASKVRHLEVCAPHEEISLAALHLLQYLSDCNPLLPNLVSLNWATSDPMFIPFIFISHSLILIKIASPSPMLPLVLTKISSLSPYIRDIRVDVDEARYSLSDPSMAEASSQLLMQCNPNRLRKHNIGAPISASALRHAIQLPSLEHFWLNLNTPTCQLPDPLPAVVFPSLQALSVEHNDGDHSWLNLLPAIENPALSMISVKCQGPDVVQFMEKFQLTMTGCGMQEHLEVFKLSSREEFRITAHIIACNFPFKNLTTLHLLSTCTTMCQTSELADDDIDLLTKALPCLESLILGDDPCSAPSGITFKSLYTISHRCTRLTTLQTHFNPTSLITTITANAEAWDVALGLPNFSSSDLCSVKTLNVGNILLLGEFDAAISIVALGLVGVFPYLENVEYDDEEDWEGVNDLISVCRRMGRFTLGTHNK